MLKIKSKLFDVDNTVIMLFVYFPPSSSPLYDIEVNGMIILEELLTEIRGTYSNCLFIVMGDLNARMGNLKDYICDDDAKYLNSMEWYVESKFSQSRNSKDRVINDSGYTLAEICCNFDIRTLNGRSGEDSEGEFTFVSGTGRSVIDYVLVSSELFNLVEQFRVENYDVSCHFPLSFSLKSVLEKENGTNNKENLHSYVRYNWNPILGDSYRNLLKDEISQNMCDIFYCALSDDVDDAIVVLLNIIRRAGNQMMLSNCKSVKTNLMRQPEWWNNKCEDARNEKFTVLNRCRKTNSDHDLKMYLEGKANFRNICNENKKSSKKDLVMN